MTNNFETEVPSIVKETLKLYEDNINCYWQCASEKEIKILFLLLFF